MTPPPQSRRDFARTLLRRSLLAGLGSLGLYLLARGRVCLRGHACGSCGVYARCRLPERKPRA